MTTLQLSHICAAPWGDALLQDIDFKLEPGDILALAGPNGAGKSTLLKLMAGDIRPGSGQLLLGGRDLYTLAPPERARRLAYLPQMSLLNFPYTVEEVILLGRTPHDSGRAHDQEILDQLLQLTDTTSLRQRLYTHLSGGERQRTQLARIIAQVWSEPDMTGKVLLLDEPTSALDLAHQQQVLSIVRLLAQRGCCVVLVIHDLNLAAAAAERILVLDRGRQVALGPPAKVYTEELFRQVFHLEVTISAHPEQASPLVIPRRVQLP